MVRTIVLLLIGAIAGGLAVHEFARPGPVGQASGADVGGFDSADTSLLHDDVASSGAPDEVIETLAADLDRLAAAAASPLRERALADQLMLLGRADAAFAVERALALDVPPGLVADALARLALVDPEGAIDRLGSIADPLAAREAAVAVARALGGDAEALARVLAGLPDGIGPTVVRMDFYAAITAVAPDEALSLALEEPEAGARADALRQVTAIWVVQDPREVLARLGRLPDSVLAEQIEQNVMSVWARSDPGSALARLDEVRIDNGGALTRDDLPLLELATQGDPEVTFAWALARPDGLDRGLVHRVLEHWMQRDPAAALEAWGSRLNDEERAATLRVVLRGAAATDPEGALAIAEGMSDRRDEAFVAVLAGVRDVDVALEALLRIESRRLREQGLRQFASGIGSQASAPLLAERLLASSEPEANDALGTVLAGWAARDPAGALDWYEATSGAPGGVWVARAASRVAIRDPRRAERLMEARGPDEQPRFLADMLDAMATVNFDATLAALDRWRDLPGHQDAVRRVALRRTRAQPEHAVALIDSYDAWDIEGDVAARIAVSWAQLDGDDALAWAGGLAESEGRAAAVEAAFSMQAQLEGERARRWAELQPSGPERDGYFARLYALSVARDDSDPTLLAEIGDDEFRASVEAAPFAANATSLATPRRRARPVLN